MIVHFLETFSVSVSVTFPNLSTIYHRKRFRASRFCISAVKISTLLKIIYLFLYCFNNNPAVLRRANFHPCPGSLVVFSIPLAALIYCAGRSGGRQRPRIRFISFLQIPLQYFRSGKIRSRPASLIRQEAM